MENITGLDFYLKFAKPLVLNLPKTKDKALAASWIKKIMDQSSGEEKTRLDYLMLLLFVLQRKALSPPFTEHPNNIQTLTPLKTDNITLLELAKNIVKRQYEENQKLPKNYFPYISDFSADLLEYAAIQNIENFGVHGYYATSKLPLTTWLNVENQFFPKAAKRMEEVIGPLPLFGTSSQQSLSNVKMSDKQTQASAKSEANTEVEEQMKEPPIEQENLEQTEESPTSPLTTPPSVSATTEKKTTKKIIKASSPALPLGKIVPPTEDRLPPTWGSNLLEVKDVLSEDTLSDTENVESTSDLLVDVEMD